VATLAPGARILEKSRSSSVLRITGIALEWTCSVPNAPWVARSTRRLIGHEIVVTAQRLLDGERGTCRRIRIGSARGYYATVAVGMAVGDAIYSKAHYVRTAGSFSDFFQRPVSQELHRN